MSKITPKPPKAPAGKAVQFGKPKKTPGATKAVETMQKGMNRTKSSAPLKKK